MRKMMVIFFTILTFSILICENFQKSKEVIQKKYVISDKEVVEILNSKKSALIKKEGKYKIVNTGAEGSFKGYWFEKKGIMIIFNEDESVQFIECNNNLEFLGVSVGMTFDDIKRKLGNELVVQSFYESEENKIYEMFYNYEKYAISFIAPTKTAETFGMTVTTGVSKKEITIDWLKKILGKKRSEVEKEIGKSDEIMGAGYEGYKDAFFYKNYGISIIYDKENFVEYLEAEKRKKIFKVFAGISFKDLNLVYPNLKISKTVAKLFDKDSEEVVYEIKKDIDGITFQFWAYDKDDSNTFLRIYKKTIQKQ